MGHLFKCCLYNCNKDTDKKTVLGLNGYTQKNRSQYIGLNSLIIKWRQPISLPSISLFQIVSLLVFFFFWPKNLNIQLLPLRRWTPRTPHPNSQLAHCALLRPFFLLARYSLCSGTGMYETLHLILLFLLLCSFFLFGSAKKLLCRLAYSLHSFSASYSNISFALRLKTLLSLHHFPLVLVYWFSLQNPPSCTRYE